MLTAFHFKQVSLLPSSKHRRTRTMANLSEVPSAQFSKCFSFYDDSRDERLTLFRTAYRRSLQRSTSFLVRKSSRLPRNPRRVRSEVPFVGCLPPYFSTIRCRHRVPSLHSPGGLFGHPGGRTKKKMDPRKSNVSGPDELVVSKKSE